MLVSSEMMRFIKKIPIKYCLNTLWILLMIGFIWFVLPLIQIGGHAPFVRIWVRMLLIMIILIAWGVKMLMGKSSTDASKGRVLFLRTYHDTKNRLQEIINNSIHYCVFQGKLLKAKNANSKQYRKLNTLPWYVILGPQKSGKKTLIGNSGLYFSHEKQFDATYSLYRERFADFNWWVSDHAVLLDTLTGDDKKDSQNWHRFIRLLKQARKKRPLNGIILSFNLSDLIFLSNQKRQTHILQFAHYIQKLHVAFGCYVPVYVVFTKCDLVDGFMEFFNDLSKDELQQIWGITIPVGAGQQRQGALGVFSVEYIKLIEKLRRRVLWAFDAEPNQRGRELIHAFPSQMQLLKNPIENFLQDLYSSVRDDNAMALRGVFFTSCHQAGEPADFLMMAMSKKFQLISPHIQRPERMGESYFIRQLFPKRILPEASRVGESQHAVKLRYLRRLGLKIVLPIALLGVPFGMFQAYEANITNLAVLKQRAYSATDIARQIDSANPDVSGVLPLLNKLSLADKLAKTHQYGLFSFLIGAHVVMDPVHQALMDALHRYFLVRIAYQLQHDLTQGTDDHSLRYARLKGYLAFSDRLNNAPFTLMLPMAYDWQQRYVDQPILQKQLNHYLKLAISAPIDKLPLNESLIDQQLDKIEHLTPGMRAYKLLMLSAKISTIAHLDLTNNILHLEDVFQAPAHPLGINQLYTAKGFNTILLNNESGLVKEVSAGQLSLAGDDNEPESLSVDELTSELRSLYNEHYLSAWTHVLDQLSVKKVSTINEAILLIDRLTAHASPMSALIRKTRENTASISGDNITIANDFATFNDYANSAYAGYSWKRAQIALRAFEQALNKMQQAKNTHFAAYKMIQSAISGQFKALNELISQVNNAPMPIKKWLASLVNNDWQLIINSASAYINQRWQNEVYQEYANNISNRYPVDKQAATAINIANFNAFFGPKGTLDHFIHTVLGPFINNQSGVLYLRQTNGLTLGLSQKTMQQLNRLRQIQLAYFLHNRKSAYLRLTIKPETLDEKMRSVSLAIGDKIIDYRHGPLISQNISWPLPSNNDISYVMITDFLHQQAEQSVQGPWSLFRLLSLGQLKTGQAPGEYKLTYNLSGGQATFLITGPTKRSILSLSSLSDFTLPNMLAPDFQQSIIHIKDHGKTALLDKNLTISKSRSNVKAIQGKPS